MIRKILGVLLFIESLFILVGAIANGSLMGNHGSTAATYGSFVGTMLPVIVNVLGGIFLLGFDKVYTQPYINGFYARKKQCVNMVLLIAFYAVALFLVGIGAGTSGANNFLVAFIIAALPYFVPLMIFALVLGMYAVPYWACQKNFKWDEQMLNEYISVNETFYTYSADNSVLATNKVLFFPKTFCVIPFDQIASTKFYNVIEQDAIFTLVNGKQLSMVANKQQYDGIVAAIETMKQ